MRTTTWRTGRTARPRALSHKQGTRQHHSLHSDLRAKVQTLNPKHHSLHSDLRAKVPYACKSSRSIPHPLSQKTMVFAVSAPHPPLVIRAPAARWPALSPCSHRDHCTHTSARETSTGRSRRGSSAIARHLQDAYPSCIRTARRRTVCTHLPEASLPSARAHLRSRRASGRL